MAIKRSRRDDSDGSDEEALLARLAEETNDDEYVPLKQRRAAQHGAASAATAPAATPAGPGVSAEMPPPPPRDGGRAAATSAAAASRPPLAAALPPAPPQRSTTSLLKSSVASRQGQGEVSEAERVTQEEGRLMESLLRKQALRSVQENAAGVVYSDPIQTGWTPPRWVCARSEEEHQSIRDALHIDVSGTRPPPPVTSFTALRLPAATLRALTAAGIAAPTPIQAQGLPAVLSGRDVVGISYTGSGKTLVFALPLVLLALQEEWRLPLQEGEGPLGLVVGPSRELARQTHGIIEEHAAALAAAGWPELRCMLCVGGEGGAAAAGALRRGVHIATCTPGRLKDFLAKRKMNLDICRYLCLDEADRMVDTGFEEDLREIMSYFRGRRQTVMFSATMPDKIRAFAASALVEPITINVSRAGAANLDVLQEIEYVKAEDKLQRVGECLQKTPPPVLVFAERTRDVDMVHEYLLTKGVDAVAVHGGKDQQERTASITQFKQGTADVLCATDIAGKGLDFDGIKHVINFDMPEEIENYVHRIGRTGRRGRTGLATTFVSLKDCSETALLDLKYLLREAKQRIPPVLQAIEDPMEKFGEVEQTAGHQGCAYCGGLGHRLQNCPKLRAESRQALQQHTHRGPERGFGGEM